MTSRSLSGSRKQFAVVIPAYNRAHTLSRALKSLLEQTYPGWIAIVVDDGSTDDTPTLIREWQHRDERIEYYRFEQNRGVTAANEFGLDLACEKADWWTRLGSDDWFEPHKLEFDARALKCNEAVYGPFRHLEDGELNQLDNLPESACRIRAKLLNELTFAASWANIAVTTRVLRRIKARYGQFCDPRLLNMEDFIINSRICRTTDFVWRGKIDGKFVVDPDCEMDIKDHDILHDAIWRNSAEGATANFDMFRSDHAITRLLIIADEYVKS